MLRLGEVDLALAKFGAACFISGAGMASLAWGWLLRRAMARTE